MSVRDSRPVNLVIIGPLQRALGANAGRVRRALLWHALHALAIHATLVVVAVVAARLVASRLDTPFVWLATGFVLLSVVVALVAAGAGNRMLFAGCYDMGRQLRMDLVTAIRSAPVGVVLKRPRGELTSIVYRDVDDVETFISGLLPEFTSAAIAPIVLSAVVLAIDPVVGAALVLSFVLVALGFRFKLRRQARHIAYRRELRATQDERVVEFIQGIEVAKAFGIRSELSSRLDDSLREYRAENLSSVRQTIPLTGALAAGASLLAGANLAVAGWRFIESQIEAASLVALLILVAGAIRAVLAIAEYTGGIPATAASLDRINEVLSLPRQPVPGGGPQPAGHDVTFEGVEFRYDEDRPVLRGVDFRAPAGTTTAIVGKSGAGKTTILHLLAGLWNPDAGRITVGNVDLNLLSPDQREEVLSIVLQDTYLPGGTVREAIAGGRDLDDRALVSAARTAQCWDLIESLPMGLDTPIGEGGKQLSGGERQRIAIARALAGNTPIVCLDEATAALDPTTERHLQEAMTSLLANRTVIVVAHRPSTIRAADRIVVLDEGRVVESGTHEQLMAIGGVYARRTEALDRSTRGFRN